MAQDAVFPIRAHWQTVGSEIEALNHFKESPFYIVGCNNDSSEIPLNDLGLNVLKRMVGHEYVIDSEASSKPTLWIIRHQYRTSPTESSLIGAYYLLFGNIYKAPQALQLIESRLSKVYMLIYMFSLHIYIYMFHQLHQVIILETIYIHIYICIFVLFHLFF
jgi:hypothetical protein